jgi:hypothetical protein
MLSLRHNTCLSKQKKQLASNSYRRDAILRASLNRRRLACRTHGVGQQESAVTESAERLVNAFSKLQNGSDVRGIAIDGALVTFRAVPFSYMQRTSCVTFCEYCL